jgi:hypothetical protein
MKTFFLDIKSSVYNPSFYKELLNKSFSYSLKYYALFGLLVSILASVVFAFVYLPDIKNIVNKVAVQVIDYYPQELQLTLKNNQVSTNVPEPYYIKAPTGFSGDDYRIENIVVIDTFSPFSFEKFRDYKSLAWITRNGIVFVDEDTGELGGARYLPLENMPDFVLTGDGVQSFWAELKPILGRIVNLITVFVLVGAIFWFSWLMLYLLILALVIRLIAGKELDYKKAYQLGLHLFTPAVLVVLLSMAIGFSLPFLFTIAAVIFAFLNLKGLKPEPVQTQQTQQTASGA